MRYEDLNRLKGISKDVVVKWSHLMIDRMFPEMPVLRSRLKNAAHNVISRFDGKMNDALDGLFLMMADETGKVDSDTMVDAIADIIGEMPVMTIPISPFSLDIGKGAVEMRFPSGPFWESITGSLGGFRLTREDFLEMKQFFN